MSTRVCTHTHIQSHVQIHFDPFSVCYMNLRDKTDIEITATFSLSLLSVQFSSDLPNIPTTMTTVCLLIVFSLFSFGKFQSEEVIIT